MLVLLPPSEGKSSPARGRAVDLERLAFPELGERRAAMIERVDPSLAEAPAARARDIYTGVLFAQLRLGEIAAPARRRVLIFSGLWGVLRPDDRIPTYKLPIGTRVPGVGGLASHWRPALSEALPDRGLVLDLRSGPYEAAWRPQGASVVSVRGFTESPSGERKVISHMVKRVRGDVARAALSAGPRPRTPEDIASAAERAGLRVELARTAAGWTLDVVEAGGGGHPTSAAFQP